MRIGACGHSLPPRKERGHRDREYCSNACRQRAFYQRNKERHRMDKIVASAKERMYNAVFQEVFREKWQDELLSQQKYIDVLLADIARLETKVYLLTCEVGELYEQVATKSGEVAFLQKLLDDKAKKRKK
jgi:hypothetical protein